MTTLAPRIFVTEDPDAAVRAIANTAKRPHAPFQDELLVSLNGTTFHTVLFDLRSSGKGRFNGTVRQPAQGIDGQKIDFADGEITYDGKKYVLDENATIGEIITRPVMRIVMLASVHDTYYIAAQNLLTGMSHDYFDSQPLTIVDSIGVRSDLVVCNTYEGHEYAVQGDHMDRNRQVATFDGQVATQLDPDDFLVTFADDLSTVTVTRK